jgi:hypothetical protein
MKASDARQLAWICPQCAYDAGARPFPGHLATFHTDECGSCHEQRSVTEPRDFDWRGVPK